MEGAQPAAPQPFTNSKDWDEFDSTLSNWQVLGGRGNVGDNWFAGPKEPYRGMSLRAYNVEKQEWLSWWLDGRDPANIGTPVRGKFIAGTGTLIGDDNLQWKAQIKVRSQWTRTETTHHMGTSRVSGWRQDLGDELGGGF